MGHHTITEIENERFEFNSKSRIIVSAIFVIGLILTIIGVFQIKGAEQNAHHSEAVEQTDHNGQNQGEEANETVAEHNTQAATESGHESSWITRFWSNFLLNSFYFTLFAVAALFFIALNYAANAGWATLLKRVAESISSYLPIALLTILVIVFLGAEHLYHWMGYVKAGYQAGDAGFDTVMESKLWFLNKGWFFIGTPLIVIIWILFRQKLRKLSLNEDADGGGTFMKKSVTYSAAFLVVFAFSFSMLTWLLMMSIDSHWYSTIYSVYNFAIAFVTGMAVIGMFTLYLKSKGYLSAVSDDVVHDVGKFMFAFSIFWGYIWVSQYLLIWYANIPEESIYFKIRTGVHYKALFQTNIIMCFVLPFLLLMTRNSKRRPNWLMLAGVVILVGHWLDIYLMIMPGTLGENAGIGLLEIGMTMTFAGFFIYWVLNNLTKASIYPMNHPYLLESVNHDVGV